MNHSTSPVPPIPPGWRVTYRDDFYRLRDGVVAEIYMISPRYGAPPCWHVRLESGQEVTAYWIVSVTEVRGGRVIAGWSVRRHGWDGQKERTNGSI